MAEVDVSFSRDIGVGVAAGAASTDAVSNGELKAGAAGDHMPGSICHTASAASGSAANGARRADQLGR